MTRKEGLSQISSLSYLPQKAALTQPKVQLCDSSRSSVSLLFFFPPAMHSHPLPCASSTGICLTRQPASPGSYGSKKLFYSLQNMMFFASTAPLDCLRVCKGGPSALLCSCSPWQHKLSRSHSPKEQTIAEARGESELLKPFLLPNALVQTTSFIFPDYHTVWY